MSSVHADKAKAIEDCLATGNMLKAKLLCAGAFKERGHGRPIFRLVLKNILGHKINILESKHTWYGGAFYSRAWTLDILLKEFLKILEFLSTRDKIPLGKFLTVKNLGTELLFISPSSFSFLLESGIVVISDKAVLVTFRSGAGISDTARNFHHYVSNELMDKLITDYSQDKNMILQLPLNLATLVVNMSRNLITLLDYVDLSGGMPAAILARISLVYSQFQTIKNNKTFMFYIDQKYGIYDIRSQRGANTEDLIKKYAIKRLPEEEIHKLEGLVVREMQLAITAILPKVQTTTLCTVETEGKYLLNFTPDTSTEASCE